MLFFKLFSNHLLNPKKKISILVTQYKQKVKMNTTQRYEITNSLINSITGMLVIISVIILRKPGW
jgi:hypothetical protein